ncbi:MAG: hypothetical protein NVSMB9_25320 [Isosphaeraceae bacterium]
MPFPLLLALFLAFGFDPPARPGPSSWSRSETLLRTGEVAVALLLITTFAFLLGRFVSSRIQRNGHVTAGVRRAYVLGVRFLEVLSLVLFGVIIHVLDWPRVIRQGFGLGDPVLLDDALILLPYVVAQLAGWWGIHAAERALRPSYGLVRHLWIKARQSLGMVLPVAGLYVLALELVRRRWPGVATSPWEQPLSLGMLGLLMLVLAPALVRIAWPTRPLPQGPLRDRLENLAGRAGFRCTDILVWDTNQVIVNAGVTGSLPWFRYVLLTDALVEYLGPHEVAAVFGHEVGHIAHRHLPYFGFFIFASVLALFFAGGALDPLLVVVPSWVSGDSLSAHLVKDGGSLLVMGLYFLVVFGFLSRRFERQADVFGCRVVSCGRPDCPPHADLDGRPEPGQTAGPLCPVGIRIFVNALANVAMLNGMKPSAWSWRHGSIMRRIDFLESLVDRPEAETRFQTGVLRMRRRLATVLLVSIVALAVLTVYLQ